MPLWYVLFAQLTAAGTQGALAGCLPEGISLEEVASAPSTKSSPPTVTTLTVGNALANIKARCRKTVLLDGRGRQIRFYRLIGCWGNPPADYQEQQHQQSRELAELKRKFTVIEIPCVNDPRKGSDAW